MNLAKKDHEPHSQPLSINYIRLATCVNYADINNSILHMRGHISAGQHGCHECQIVVHQARTVVRC